MKFISMLLILSVLSACTIYPTEYQGVITEIGTITEHSDFWNVAGCGIKVKLDNGQDIVVFAELYKCHAYKAGDRVTALEFRSEGVWNIK